MYYVARHVPDTLASCSPVYALTDAKVAAAEIYLYTALKRGRHSIELCQWVSEWRSMWDQAVSLETAGTLECWRAVKV